MATNEELEREIGSLKAALVQVVGALVTTRRAVNVIANQPTLMLSTEARADIYREMNESIGRIDTALQAIEMMAIPAAVGPRHG